MSVGIQEVTPRVVPKCPPPEGRYMVRFGPSSEVVVLIEFNKFAPRGLTNSFYDLLKEVSEGLKDRYDVVIDCGIQGPMVGRYPLIKYFMDNRVNADLPKSGSFPDELKKSLGPYLGSKLKVTEDLARPRNGFIKRIFVRYSVN